MNTTPTPTPAAKPLAQAPAKPLASGDLAAILGGPATRAWWQRWPFWVGMAVLLLVVIGGWYGWQQRVRAAAPVYTTVAVGTGDVTFTVTANGTLQPTRSISIGSELSGTVLQVLVDVNDPVRKGQVLVVLDTAKLRDQIKRSQAAVASAQGQLALTAATVLEAQATLDRLDAVAQLSGGKVPALTELDAARAARDRAQAAAASARAGVQDAQAALSTDQTNLGKASITAPSDGVVLTRSVDPGNAVAATLQAVTLFTLAEDLHRLRLWVYVDEADVGTVKVGQTATFSVSADVTREFPARITRVGLGSTITDNVVTYLTDLAVDNTELKLRPGMTATAHITAQQRRGVLLVPNAALRFTPTVAAAAGKSGVSGMNFGPPKVESQRQGAADRASTATARQVWVLRDVPVAVAVMPGISDGRMTEVLSGDLQPGMRVITSQQSAAK